jgi:hypothetical protein
MSGWAGINRRAGGAEGVDFALSRASIALFSRYVEEERFRAALTAGG